MSRKLLRDYAALLGGLQSLIKWYTIIIYLFFKWTVFRSILKRRTCVLQALQKGLACAPNGQYDYRKRVPISQKHCGAYINIRESEGIFRQKTRQQQPTGDDLKLQVTAAVKMCDMIAEKVKCTCPLHQPIPSQIF